MAEFESSSSDKFVPEGPVNMLVIDPQVDFHEEGSLPIPGATADSTRIAKFIDANKDNVNRIVVSLDTHTLRHIGHPGYWKRLDGMTDPLPKYTMFRVVGGIIKAKSGETDIDVEPVESKLREWTIKYISTMVDDNGNPKTEKGPPLIWPIHCIEDSPGHAVHKSLKPTLMNADIKQKVEYHIKGQNEITEMYSIFKSEVQPYSTDNIDQPHLYHGIFTHIITETSKNSNTDDVEDHAYLNVNFNATLFNSLISTNNQILICGQALSHCVNWSLRDLVSKLILTANQNYTENGKLKKDKVILLINGSSPAEGFNANVVALIQFCKEKNVSIKFLSEDGQIQNNQPKSYQPSEDIQPALSEYLSPSGGKSGRRTRKVKRRTHKVNRNNRRRSAKRANKHQKHRRTRK